MRRIASTLAVGAALLAGSASASSLLSRSVTLHGPAAIHRGGRVTLSGTVVMQLIPNRCPPPPGTCPPFTGLPVAVYSRPNRSHRFTRIATVRPQHPGLTDPSGITESFAWQLTVKPGRDTIYIAASQAVPSTWAPAWSRPFRVHVVR